MKIICVMLPCFMLASTGIAISQVNPLNIPFGTVTVVREEDKNTFRVPENIPTTSGVCTITLNPKTHRVYLPAAEFETAPPAAEGNPRQ